MGVAAGSPFVLETRVVVGKVIQEFVEILLRALWEVVLVISG